MEFTYARDGSALIDFRHHPSKRCLFIYYLILGKKKGIRLFSVSSVEFTYLSYQSLVLGVERTSVDHAKIPT